MKPLAPRPRLHALPIIAVTLGLGLGAYHGERWYKLPRYTEQDLQASVELNLAMDLERRGPTLQPSVEDRERLRNQIRQEIDADIARERREVKQGFAGAMLMLLFGGGYLALRSRSRGG
ncbi:hypothetical protein [Solimonas sp. SE-A11]|uniref:hypothetical protein n=1 Tax=Solimonas sp. SE-A11 TaxID=3054954 RepID=UPI00259CBE33|nr:hypothetical protein [Solimonas sp. SE-A11]MDM4769997.1 hypothetical protein [Solimonas sp. SE-A11]